jgi:hypothetical protein
VLLQPFFTHEASVHGEFADYHDRIAHIAGCMPLVFNQGRPELEYSLVPASNMQAMLDFQDEHYNSALPMCLHMARNTLDAASAQLAAVYMRIIDVIALRWNTRLDSTCLSTSTFLIHRIWASRTTLRSTTPCATPYDPTISSMYSCTKSATMGWFEMRTSLVLHPRENFTCMSAE